MIVNRKLSDIIPTFMKESCKRSFSIYDDAKEPSIDVPEPPLLTYETSISISSWSESSSGLSLPSTTTSTRSCDSRAIALVATESSVNALLDCLTHNGVQHISMDSISTIGSDDIDYLHILTMAQNHVNNLTKSSSVSISTKKVLTDSLMKAWKNLSHFLGIQHQIAYKSYHTLRRELEEECTGGSFNNNDRFVHPSVYTKIKKIQQQKVNKTLYFMNEVSELYFLSLKDKILTQNLINQLS